MRSWVRLRLAHLQLVCEVLDTHDNSALEARILCAGSGPQAVSYLPKCGLDAQPLTINLLCVARLAARLALELFHGLVLVGAVSADPRLRLLRRDLLLWRLLLRHARTARESGQGARSPAGARQNLEGRSEGDVTSGLAGECDIEWKHLKARFLSNFKLAEGSRTRYAPQTRVTQV